MCVCGGGPGFPRGFQGALRCFQGPSYLERKEWAPAGSPRPRPMPSDLRGWPFAHRTQRMNGPVPLGSWQPLAEPAGRGRGGRLLFGFVPPEGDPDRREHVSQGGGSPSDTRKGRSDGARHAQRHPDVMGGGGLCAVGSGCCPGPRAPLPGPRPLLGANVSTGKLTGVCIAGASSCPRAASAPGSRAASSPPKAALWEAASS